MRGELSRFKLREKLQGVSSYICICGDPAHGPSSVRSRNAKTDIKGKVVCVIEGEEVV